MTDPLLGATLGQFKIISELGHGGMASVYRAVQQSLNRTVALKVMAHHLARDPSFLARFEREARIAAQLMHPNILPVIEYGEDAGIFYIATAYIAGGTLEQRTRQPMTPTDTVRLVGQTADGLGFAHEKGVVHRDIKPSNILLGEHDWVVLGDFGIARLTEGDDRITSTGVTIGTAAYMSPEQAEGRSDLDGRSDLYSLGIMAYQLLTGRLPFDGPTPYAIIYKQIHESVPSLRTIQPGLPASFDAVLQKALAKRPEDRFRTANEFKHALEQCLLSDQTRVRAPDPEPSVPVVDSSARPSIARRPTNSSPAVAQLKKVFAHERRGNFDDRVIMGGIDRFLQQTLALLSAGLRAEQRELIEMFNFPSYTSTPRSERAQWLENVERWLTEEFPALPGMSGLVAPLPQRSFSAPPPFAINIDWTYLVRVETRRGEFVIKIDPSLAPNTANNFIGLCRAGFYDGLTFHRVEDWLVQGGDPTGTGSGGPGYTFDDEPVRGPYTPGVVAMANAGPNTNGSQFFILKTHVPIQPTYNLFGRVGQGQDTVDQIQVGDVMTRVSVRQLSPSSEMPF